MTEEFGRLTSLSKDKDFIALQSDPLIARIRHLYEDAATAPLPDFMQQLLVHLNEAERRR